MASTLRDIVLLLRPWFWLPGVAPGVAGCLWAANGAPSWATVVLVAVILGPGICAFAEVLNEVCDESLDSGATVKRYWGIPLASGSGVLVHRGKSAARVASRLIVGTVVVGAAASSVLSVRTILAAAVGYSLAWAYSAPPLRAKGKAPWGTLLQGLGYGPVAFYVGYSSVETPAAEFSVAVGLLLGVWVAVVGVTADLLDFEDDARQGVRTVAVWLGPARTRLVAVVGGATCLLVGLASSWTRLGLTTFALWLALVGAFVAYCHLLLTHKGSVPPSVHAVALGLELAFPLALTLGLR